VAVGTIVLWLLFGAHREFLAQQAQYAQRAPIPLSPVAVSGIGAGQVAVLNKSGEVLLIDRNNQKQLIRRVDTQQASDMAGIQTGNGYTLLVSSWRQSGLGSVVGNLELLPGGQPFSRTGALYSGVTLAGPLNGYTTDGRSREIFRVAISGGRLATTFLSAVPDKGAVLGSLAADPEGGTLYVVDVYGGKIWQAPTSGGTPTAFVSDLRDPRAIAVDGNTVFVADGDAHKIFAFPRAGRPQGAPSPRVIAPRELREPAGLALAGNNEIWVGDSAARAVFLVSLQDGQVKRTIQ
jgi:DNA-binding beta-propeller fold protein YncE